MPNKDGTITLKDVIQDEALRWGDVYAINVEKAIEANNRLIASSKTLNEVVGQYRTVGNNAQMFDVKGKEKNALDALTQALRDEQQALKDLNEERQKQIALEKAMEAVKKARQKTDNVTKKAIDEERLAHTKNTNSIKEEEKAEISKERVKRESLKTEKEALEVASKTIQQEREHIKTMTEYEKLEQKKLATGKEEARLLRDLEKLEQDKLNTDKALVSLLKEEERLKRERLATLKDEKALIEQEQRLIKSNLDIKSRELRIAQQEEAAKKRNTVLTEEEKVQNEILNRVKKQQARENLGLVGAYEKLNRQRTEAQKNLANLLAAEHRNTDEVRKAQREYEILNKRVREVDNAVDIFQKNIGNYKGAFDGLGGALNSLVAAFGVTAGISSFVDVLQKAFDIIRNYEAEVVNLAAIAGKTRDEIAPLEETIQAVAAASINSATDVAKLATELIKLGSTPEEAEKLLKPVNDLSLALRASAEDSATLVKSLLNAYQEGADQAVRFTDVLAESANRSALDFAGLRDAFSYLAPTAKTLNFSIEKTAAILGILADNGIKAESAGRLTSTALIRLSQDGVSLEEALKRLNDAQQAGATELEQLAIAGELFGAEAAKIGIILANNTDKIGENTVAYENSQGALEELTNKQLKSLDAQLKILDSSFEDYVLKTNESIGASKTFTSIVKFLSENLGLMINTLIAAAALYITYRAAILAASVASKLNTAAIYGQIIANGLLKGGIAGLRAEVAALNVVTKLNPFALILTAVVGLIYYLSTLKKNLSEITEETKKSTNEFLKSRDTQEKNISSMEKMIDRHDDLKGKINKTTAEQKELAEITKTLGVIVPDATRKMNGYGEALVISSDKIREYIKLQKEVIALKADVELDKNVKVLRALELEQRRFNQAVDESSKYETFVKALGENLRTVNGVLTRRQYITGKQIALTKEELLIFKQAALKNEQEIAQTQQRINALKKLQDQANDTNAAVNGGKSAPAGPKPRTIELIDEEIQAERDKINALTYNTREQGKLIDKRIKALEKEREAIYSTARAEKDAKKIREEALAAMRKVDEDAYNLMVFRLNRLKAVNDEIIADVNETDQERVDATIRNEQILLALNEEALEKRLKEISRYNDKVRDLTDKEIETLISGGEGANAIRAKLTNEELLAFEQFQTEREKIYKASEANIDKLEVDRFDRELKAQLRRNDIALNNELIGENDRFNAEEINNANREKAVEQHEKNIAEIKKKYAIEALNAQIKSLEDLLATETVAADKRAEIEKTISDAKRELSDLTTKTVTENNDKEELSEKEKAERIKEMTIDLKNALVDLANTIFDARIQKIDDEIARNEEFYNRQIELAGEDQRKKDLLEKEAERKRQELEKKKREEQRKQAIFNKVIKLAEIATSTALAVMQAYAQLGPIAGNVGAALVIAAGAIQAATVIATPIPKYKGGRKGGPAEVAWVGDGFVNEIIEDKKGAIRITPNKPTLTQLDEGDTVHSSKEAYYNHLRKSMLSNVYRETERLNYINSLINKDPDNENLEKSIEKAIEKGFKKARINNNINMPKIDLGHEFWAANNKKW